METVSCNCFQRRGKKAQNTGQVSCWVSPRLFEALGLAQPSSEEGVTLGTPRGILNQDASPPWGDPGSYLPCPFLHHHRLELPLTVDTS